MTQISSSLGGLNSKSSYLSASKTSHSKNQAKARADIIYENPNNFPKNSLGKNFSFQDNSASFFKGKSIDEFLRTSAKKSKPLADLPYYGRHNHRVSEDDDSISENLDGLSHSDHNSSEMGRFQKVTPEPKGKFTPGTYSVKKTLEAKATRYQQQDLGSTAFKTPVTKDYFQDSKQATARKLFAQAPTKETIPKSARKFSSEEIEDEISPRIEEETQDEEDFENNDARNMRIALASSKKDSVKRYNVFEDWRILESVDFYIKENGTRGILSKAVWEKLVDPKTGSKVLSGTRSNESMRERYKRWLRRMTPEDREEMINFVRKYPKEYLERYNCMFDKGQNQGSEKKMLNMEAISDASPDENFLNSPPARVSHHQVHQNSARTKTSGVKTPRFDLEEDDIQNFEDLMPSQRYETVPLQNSSKKVNKKPESIVKKNFSSKETNFQVQDVSGKKRLLNVNLYEERFNDEETNDLHHTKKIKTDGMGKSTHHIVRTIQKTTPKSTTMEEEQPQKLQEKPADEELGGELEEMIKTRNPKKFEDMNLDIMIFVDDVKGERTFMQNPRDIKTQPRLVKIAKEHKMELKNLLEIFYSLSNDYDDLENLLKHGDDSYVWTPIDDKGLLENDPTAMHYLKLIKGEERINKRKMFLLREFN